MEKDVISYGELSLRDVVNKDLDTSDVCELWGVFIHPHGDGEYALQYDGHAGGVKTIHNDDYDDVLELVEEIHRITVEIAEMDREELVEYAGRIMTEDKTEAENSPHYIYVGADP
jgi:hypothetical protein